MRAWPTTRFAVGAVAIALASGLLGLPWVVGRWGDAMPWAVSGWGATAAVGIAAGIWMAYQYGRAGSGFLIGIVAGMLARMLIVGLGTAAAIRLGGSGPWGFLAGFALGFVPLQTYELVWFIRAARDGDRRA